MTIKPDAIAYPPAGGRPEMTRRLPEGGRAAMTEDTSHAPETLLASQRHKKEWPSGVEAPSDISVLVHGRSVKLDFVAFAFGDPFGLCRQLKALGLSGRIGFRTSDGMIGLVTTINAGAELTVSETSGSSPRFVKWKPFPGMNAIRA